MSTHEIGQLTLYQARMLSTDRKALGGVQQLDPKEAAAVRRRLEARKQRESWPSPVVTAWSPKDT